MHKINGKEVDHGTLNITPDSKALLIHTIATDGEGATHTSDEKELRVGSGTALAGTWRNTRVGVNVSDPITLEDAGGGRNRWGFPNDGQYYVIAPNGEPAKYEEPRTVPGVTVALQSASPKELHWIESISGKPHTKGIDQLSIDGKVLTETTWSESRPGDRQVAIDQRK